MHTVREKVFMCHYEHTLVVEKDARIVKRLIGGRFKKNLLLRFITQAASFLFFFFFLCHALHESSHLVRPAVEKETHFDPKEDVYSWRFSMKVSQHYTMRLE